MLPADDKDKADSLDQSSSLNSEPSHDFSHQDKQDMQTINPGSPRKNNDLI